MILNHTSGTASAKALRLQTQVWLEKDQPSREVYEMKTGSKEAQISYYLVSCCTGFGFSSQQNGEQLEDFVQRIKMTVFVFK